MYYLVSLSRLCSCYLRQASDPWSLWHLFPGFVPEHLMLQLCFPSQVCPFNRYWNVHLEQTESKVWVFEVVQGGNGKLMDIPGFLGRRRDTIIKRALGVEEGWSGSLGYWLVGLKFHQVGGNNVFKNGSLLSAFIVLKALCFDPGWWRVFCRAAFMNVWGCHYVTENWKLFSWGEIFFFKI